MWVLSLYSFISMAAEWVVNTFLAGMGIIAVNKSAWHIIYEKPSQLDFLVLNFRWLEGELRYKTMACKAMPDFKAATLVSKVSMCNVAWPGFPACSVQPAEPTDNCLPHRDGSTWTKSRAHLTADIWRKQVAPEPCPTKCCASSLAAELKSMQDTKHLPGIAQQPKLSSSGVSNRTSFRYSI